MILITLPPFALLPSEYDPETNKQTTITQEINLVSSEPMFGKLDWVAGFFYLNTEIEISILERLDFGFDGVFDPFTVDDVYSYSGDFGLLQTQNPRETQLHSTDKEHGTTATHLELYLG